MKRFDITKGRFPALIQEHVDGEWIRYSDHVEAMKRIAAAPVAQGLDVDAVMTKIQEFASTWAVVGGRFDDGTAMECAEECKAEIRAILAQSAQSASAQQAEPVAWLFDNKEDGKHWYDTPQPMGRPVYAAPAPGTSSLTAEDYAPFYAAHHAGARAQQEPANPYAAQGSLEEAWQRGFDGQRGLAAPGSNYDKVWHEGAAARKAYDAGRAAPAPSDSGPLINKGTKPVTAEDVRANRRNGESMWDTKARLEGAPSASPICTCPSGDGSLRHPCPSHPSASPASDNPVIGIAITEQNQALASASPAALTDAEQHTVSDLRSYARSIRMIEDNQGVANRDCIEAATAMEWAALQIEGLRALLAASPIDQVEGARDE